MRNLSIQPGFVALFIGSILIGCGPAMERRAAKPPAINIPQLVNKSAQEVDAILGPAKKTVDITDGPDAPGEYRDYRILDNRYTLTIRFFRGKPARFVCDLTPALKSKGAGDVAALFGFDVAEKAEKRIGSGAYEVKFWQGDFRGISFQDVRVTRDSSSNDGFSEFRATPSN